MNTETEKIESAEAIVEDVNETPFFEGETLLTGLENELHPSSLPAMIVANTTPTLGGIVKEVQVNEEK